MEYVGALLLACSMFAVWLIAITLTSTLLWMALRVVGFVRNRRMAIISIVPFVAGSAKTVVGLLRPVFIVGIVVLVLNSQGGSVTVPTPGPVAQLYGEIAFCISFLLFAALYLPRAYGASVMDNDEDEGISAYNRSSVVASLRFNGALFVLSTFLIYRGPYCIVSVVLILGYAIGITYAALRAKSLNRFSQAPRISIQPPNSVGSLLFVHVSDVHVTCEKNGIPTGGGRSGLENLRRLADLIENNALQTSIVAVSGDLVDRGDADEWKLAMAPLRKIRSRGIGVVLAPGNHDILPSYSPSGLLWAAIRPGAAIAAIDGLLVRRYLDAALELEPEITTWNGTPLKEYLANFDSPWQRLRAIWDEVRAEAANAIGLPPETHHPDALKKYRRINPEAAKRLEARFVAAAVQSYPKSNAEYWRSQIYIFGPKTLAEVLEHDPWNARWYDPYPLRIARQDLDIEILIANSTPQNPLLGQSSLGATGEEQIDRLEAAVNASQACRVLILHHHTFLRWEDDPFNFQRWGTLSHDGKESRRLNELLLRNAGDKRDIAVLTGHTHSLPRGGLLTPENGKNVWYFESAALGDDQGRELLTGQLDGDGRLQCGRLILNRQ